MKRLGIEAVECSGKDVTLVVHCNPKGRPVGGGRHSWFIALQSYTLKLNLAIDDIWKQLAKELEAIK
jgi:hypothetical protein